MEKGKEKEKENDKETEESEAEEEEESEAEEEVEKVENRYSEAWEDSDVVFTIEDEEFHCHCVILKLNSPVFRKTFKKKKREKKQSKAKDEDEKEEDKDKAGGRQIDLPGKEKESFTLFLDFMYPIPPDYHLTTDRDKLSKVLEYCEEYQADCVKARVDYILYSKIYSQRILPLTLPVIMKDLKISTRFGLEATRKESFSRLLKLTHELDMSSYDETVYEELPMETKYEVVTGLLRVCFHSGFITKGFNMNKLLDSLSKSAKKATD